MQQINAIQPIAKKLDELKLKIDELGILVAPSKSIPGLKQQYPQFTPDQLKLFEKLLSNEAIVKTLSDLSEKEILKLIEDLMKNPEFGGPGEVPPPPSQGGMPPTEEEGEIPPPPGQEEEEGEIPPPPGEGMPSEEEAKKKKEPGLSDQELAELSTEDKVASDNEMIAVLNLLALVHADDLDSYASLVERNVASLGSKKGSLFKFKQGNDPKNLGQAIKKFIKEKFIPSTGSAQEKLKQVTTFIDNKNKIEEFVSIFKPWILGSGMSRQAHEVVAGI